MEIKMNTITVSPKYQIVIPKKIREELKLKPGQKLQVIQAEDRIEYIIIKDIRTPIHSSISCQVKEGVPRKYSKS